MHKLIFERWCPQISTTKPIPKKMNNKNMLKKKLFTCTEEHSKKKWCIVTPTHIYMSKYCLIKEHFLI